MPDTRKGHNPSGAPDPTRARAENNIQKDEKRVHDLIHVLRYVADGDLRTEPFHERCRRSRGQGC